MVQLTSGQAPERLRSSRTGTAGAYGATLALTVTVAVAAFMIAMSLVLLVVHPGGIGVPVLSSVVNQQSQDAKTALYVLGFAVILPLALYAVPKLVARIGSGPNRDGLGALAGSAAGLLATTIIAIRLSANLPWGDGLGTVLAGALVYCAVAGAALARSAQPRAWAPLTRAQGHTETIALVAGALVFAAVLCLTRLGSLSLSALILGAVVIVAAAAALGRVSVRRPPRPVGAGLDVVVVLVLLLAVPDVVILTTSTQIPNAFFEPGILQFQQDWILGPANQLLGGGAVLVNSPVSQYGVGMLYFLAGWFHIAPIGYGTFGLLDGILTALVYAGAYGLLRLARIPRLLAAAALAVAVVALIYGLQYPVGGLPEQGPLRFGMPMPLLLALVAAARWPRHARAARGVALGVLGISSIWALEAFFYTSATFAAVIVLQACLRPVGDRARWPLAQAGLGLAACVIAQLLFAVATLAGSGHLPDWGQYFAYLHALLLGGIEGSITYGFQRWSPDLVVAAGCVASAAAIVLLVRLRVGFARREQLMMTALAGTTAYQIAVFSYADNRSSTYLLLYVALPALLAAVMWLALLVRAGGLSDRARIGVVAFALGLAVVPIAAAWPSVSSRFSRSALAHAYPGGGLRAALHRLWHLPAIDPRAPEGVRLLARYVPGNKAIVLLPTSADLSLEILMRSKRTNRLFIGYGNMDSFVPSVWKPKISAQLNALAPGDRVLVDRTALSLIAFLRSHPAADPLDPFTNPLAGGTPQTEWVLRELDKRFALVPIARDAQGFVVARLARR
jgi:hypothetical protein